MSLSNNDNPPLRTQTTDDIFAELNKDDEIDLKPKVDDKKDDKSDKDDKLDASDDDEDKDKKDDKKDEEEDELALLEEDLEEPDEEKLELVTPVKRREILKAYPDLFKKFPYLEKAYYREQQFTEILPTIEDAKTAAESHRVLQAYTEDMVEKGNVKNVLKMIKDANPDTFAEVADNYLDHLKSVDADAFTHVQSNLVKNVILGMVQEANENGDDDLKTAALLLNKWAFGTNKFTPPQKMAKDVKPEDKSKENELSEKEKAFAKRQLDAAVGEVNNRVNNSIKSAIETNIDPRKVMTDYVRTSAIRDAQEKIVRLIENDTRFQKIVDKLWDKSAKEGYSKESQDEIRRAFLSKAKSLLEPVLKSSRNAALKGMGKRVKEDDEVEDNEPEPKRQKTENNERRLSSGDKQKAKLDSLKGKSTLEAMNELMGEA
jgi:hypothetical protein